MRFFVNKFEQYHPGVGNYVHRDRALGQITRYVDLISSSVPPTQEYGDGGLYVGTGGIGYMMYQVYKSGGNAGGKWRELLPKAREYARSNIEYITSRKNHQKTMDCAFLLGSAGLYAINAVIEHTLSFVHPDQVHSPQPSIKQFTNAASVCLGGNIPDELFVGRAGYLCGLLWLRKELATEIISECELNAILDRIVHSGRQYSQVHRSPARLMYSYYGTEYFGAAHGISAILMMLLSFPKYLHAHPDVEKDIRSSVDFLLSVGTPDGNYPPAMDDVHHQRPPEYELVHWCHGAPGLVYMFAKAYMVWKDQKYLDACLRCGELTWEKGLLKKGPGICHGIAGSGYVFLLLYRLTKDEKHLYRAWKFAEFLDSAEFRSYVTKPDCPYSLYEGLAGTVCFLVDLLQPEKSAFPFFDVL